MKESEFIELLNLYVDHELSTADSARLEAEVANNAARRQAYREYCMMHKACDILAAAYRDPEAQTPRFIMQQEKSAGWGWGTGLVTGGLLAAACLALAFVLHVRQSNPAPMMSAEVATTATEVPAARRIAPHLMENQLQPVLNTRDWTNPAAVQNESLAWMNKVELTPLSHSPSSVQLPAFPATPLMLNADGTAVTPVSATPENQIERVAFQFQR